MNWCILIPVLIGLISALLGYLLGKLLSGSGNHDECNNKISRLEADLKTCKSSRLQLENDLLSANANLASKTSEISNMVSSFAGAETSAVTFDSMVAKTAFGKKIKKNDLTVIEGIGPKIQELFHNFNIKTWASLATTSIAKCQEVLDNGGASFKMHNPQTWSEQADLAAKGKWQKLKDWQDVLDGGK